jgi:hypothetical protein
MSLLCCIDVVGNLRDAGELVMLWQALGIIGMLTFG